MTEISRLAHKVLSESTPPFLVNPTISFSSWEVSTDILAIISHSEKVNFSKTCCFDEIMADQADAATVTESVAKLVLDEETGEQVSKSELKKRQKKRENDRKKVYFSTEMPGLQYSSGGVWLTWRM